MWPKVYFSFDKKKWPFLWTVTVGLKLNSDGSEFYSEYLQKSSGDLV